MLDVYRKFYHFTGEPFRLGPDHRFSLHHSSYANAKAYLEYAIFQGEGFVTITGAPGTGKTTLISEILSIVDKKKVEVATLTSTQLESRDLLHMVVHSFGIEPSDDNKASLLLEIESYLVSKIRSGQRVILIVDEAQSLSEGAVEELRLLANLQHEYQLLLQIILVGQEQLLELIQHPAMEHLRQRLVAATSLEPLSFDESIDYIEHRLKCVAWKGDPGIDEGALRLMYRHSGGIPRRINLIINRLFLYGGMDEKHHFAVEDAQEVIKGLVEEYLLSPDPLVDEADIDTGLAASGAGRPRYLPREPVEKPVPAKPSGSAAGKAPGAEKPEQVVTKQNAVGKSRTPSPAADMDIGSARRNQPERSEPERKDSEPTQTAVRKKRPADIPVDDEPVKKKGNKGVFIVLLLLAGAGSAYLLRDESVSLNQLFSMLEVEQKPEAEQPDEALPTNEKLLIDRDEVVKSVDLQSPESGAGSDVSGGNVTRASFESAENQEEAVLSGSVLAEPEPVVREAVESQAPVTEMQPVEAAIKTGEAASLPVDDTREARRARLRQAAEKRFSERQVNAQARTTVPARQIPPPPVTEKVPPIAVKRPVVVSSAVQPRKKQRITADKVKQTLLQGRWSSAGKPASLLPSEATFCREQSAGLACSSVPQNVKTQYGLALYKVETTLSRFSPEGHFELAYRTLVRLIDGDPSKQPASDDSGWQVTEYSMSCTLSGKNRVTCLDGKGITREYRQASLSNR